MVEYSLECLKNLAVDEVSIEEMMDEGSLEVLMNVMKLNPYNEKIQQMVNKVNTTQGQRSLDCSCCQLSFICMSLWFLSPPLCRPFLVSASTSVCLL